MCLILSSLKCDSSYGSSGVQWRHLPFGPCRQRDSFLGLSIKPDILHSLMSTSSSDDERLLTLNTLALSCLLAELDTLDEDALSRLSRIDVAAWAKLLTSANRRSPCFKPYSEMYLLWRPGIRFFLSFEVYKEIWSRLERLSEDSS